MLVCEWTVNFYSKVSGCAYYVYQYEWMDGQIIIECSSKLFIMFRNIRVQLQTLILAHEAQSVNYWHMRLNPKNTKSMVVAPGYGDLALAGAELEEV